MSNDSEASPLPLIGTYFSHVLDLESWGGGLNFVLSFGLNPGLLY